LENIAGHSVNIRVNNIQEDANILQLCNWAPLNSILVNGHRLYKTLSHALWLLEKLVAKHAPLKSKHEIYRPSGDWTPAAPADRCGWCALCLSPKSRRGTQCDSILS